MRIAKVKIQNFRGILDGEILFSDHNVLVGDNNAGKSTILEAIDLVLGPERISRIGAIDEHDFYAGEYLDEGKQPIEIKIELIVIDLNDDQKRHFIDHLEWWDTLTNTLIDSPPAEITDEQHIIPALRVGFSGAYDIEEDDFTTKTYFLSPSGADGDDLISFKTSDKRVCGFLFLRTLRTGSRALSLERGSLLDIILKLKDKRLQIWEDVLSNLRSIPVAADPTLGVSDILADVQKSLLSFLTTTHSNNPHLKVSDLTRESLRRILTVFMDTGASKKDGMKYAAPYQHQGTGTINILVLSLLSIIAELKQNVIFAMEEPEIAIPPHIQKSIIDSVRMKSSQALFTSHSPYVLEEFEPSEIIVIKRSAGIISTALTNYPPSVKPKKYRTEFRKRFCECLLADNILIVEGRTEYDTLPAASRKLHELDSDQFSTLESLGLAVINAETDSQIAPLGEYFKKLGKKTIAICDKQAEPQKTLIHSSVDHCFESSESDFEKVILAETPDLTIRNYAINLVNTGVWPKHLASETPTEEMDINLLKSALAKYFIHEKGSGKIADLVTSCNLTEMSTFLVETISSIQKIIRPSH